nr:MAG TPA: hypothetical protein [Caudoviricetes sp.]
MDDDEINVQFSDVEVPDCLTKTRKRRRALQWLMQTVVHDVYRAGQLGTGEPKIIVMSEEEYDDEYGSDGYDG